MTDGPAPRAFVATTADGLRLEGEHAVPSDPVALVVLCHPHPQHGGTMRSLVTAALFSSLAADGIATVRFNFRGVEGSEGEHGGGDAEPDDVLAVLDATASLAPGAARLLAGWSFGGDVALRVHDDRLAGWVGIAPPLRFAGGLGGDFGAVAEDERPKLLVLAQHDEVREPASVADQVAAWRSTRVEIVPGASHFFVGRTDRVHDLVHAFVHEVTNGA